MLGFVVPHELTITRAEFSDASAIESVLDAAAEWQRSRGIEQWTPGWFRDEVLERTESGDFYVARREGRVVGCFLLDPSSPSWLHQWLVERGREPTQAVYLRRLAVGREATGRGYGVEMVDEASRLAAGRGSAFIRLEFPSDNDRLRRYYVDSGFAYIGDAKMRGPDGKGWVCSVFERHTGVGPRQ
jgi:ribosomal protein S18 acetylase RimI-like enzyme